MPHPSPSDEDGSESATQGRCGGLELPPGVYGRIAMALTCLALGIPSAFLLYALVFFVRRPVGFAAVVMRLVVDSLVLWLSVWSVAGLIWAVARPGWSERVLRSAGDKVAISVGLFVLSCFLVLATT